MRLISIHAPREGSDGLMVFIVTAAPISIHAPREGSDPRPINSSSFWYRFQSTLPVRGATRMSVSWADVRPDFNPRSP